jgi:predicted RNase H-like nuclease
MKADIQLALIWKYAVAYVFISRPYLAAIFTIFSTTAGVICGGSNDDLSLIGIPISSKNFSNCGGEMINNNFPK